MSPGHDESLRFPYRRTFIVILIIIFSSSRKMLFMAKFGALLRIFPGSRRSGKPTASVNSASTGTDSPNPIITDNSSLLSNLSTLESDVGISSFSNPSTDDTSSEISAIHNGVAQAATTCLTVLKPLAGVVPFAGGSIKGVIKCLLVVLKSYEQMNINERDIAALRARLERLTGWLDVVPHTQDSLFSGLNDFLRTFFLAHGQGLFSSLNKALSKLNKASETPDFISVSAVENVIKQCSEEIDRTLLDFMFMRNLLFLPMMLNIELYLRQINTRMASTLVPHLSSESGHPSLDIPQHFSTNLLNDSIPSVNIVSIIISELT
ncbi:hypothetical protein CVT25_002308 [Psilocybe cyanescens]|uniref:Uncharacterized protein n=1 Tax=Psilocybe cyanescens TaxID=93625 RepID=A0A409WKL4_PSICY|nr:hypothetical protein CVT25_002308 [Psilocybe cyanescens]